MATTIKLKNGTGVPSAGSLVVGEPALDLTNKRLYTEDSGGTVIEVGTNPTSVTTGTVTTTGNVGIGTSSPARQLTVENASGNAIASIKSGTSNASFLLMGDTASDNIGMLKYDNADDSLGFFAGSNSVERMRIDSSGNVKIGTASDRFSFLTASTANLQIDGGVVFDPGSGNNVEIFNYRATDMLFGNSGGEDMRIDSSGNLLVSKTGTANLATDTTAGHTLYGIGIARHVASGSPSLQLTRTSSDGDIAVFTKDGSTVGNVGTSAGHLYVGAGGDTNLLFNDTANSIYPWDASANDVQDATVDLGASSARFKDLYLSSGIKASPSAQNAATSLELGVLNSGTTAYAKIDAVNLNTYDTNLRFFTNIAGSTVQEERMRIESSGFVKSVKAHYVGNTREDLYSSGEGIGLYAPNAYDSCGAHIEIGTDASDSWSCMYMNRIWVAGNDERMIQFAVNGTVVGNITSNTSSTSYSTSSDYRLKENVVPLTGAIDRVKQLKPSRFNFIADADTTVDGFLAHEVADVVPEAITGTKDGMRDEEYEVTPAVYEDVVIPAVLDEEGNEVEAERTEQQLVSEAVMSTRSVPDYQGIDQSKLVPLLVATIQELEARITALESN